MNCFPNGPETCTVCKDEVNKDISEISEIATGAIFNNGDSNKKISSHSNESKDGCDDDEDNDTGSFEGNLTASLAESCMQ